MLPPLQASARQRPAADLNRINLDINIIVVIIDHRLKKSYSGRWIEGLDEEDLSFIRRFVLASGSLKEMAGIYGISYPTIRLRLDRLIEKIKLLSSDSAEGGLERALRIEYSQGKLDAGTLNRLLEVYRREREEKS
jgi:hypothetical protein